MTEPKPRHKLANTSDPEGPCRKDCPACAEEYAAPVNIKFVSREHLKEREQAELAACPSAPESAEAWRTSRSGWGAANFWSDKAVEAYASHRHAALVAENARLKKEIADAKLYMVEAGDGEREWTHSDSLATWVHKFGMDAAAEARSDELRRLQGGEGK